MVVQLVLPLVLLRRPPGELPPRDGGRRRRLPLLPPVAAPAAAVAGSPTPAAVPETVVFPAASLQSAIAADINYRNMCGMSTTYCKRKVHQ